MEISGTNLVVEDKAQSSCQSSIANSISAIKNLSIGLSLVLPTIEQQENIEVLDNSETYVSVYRWITIHSKISFEDYFNRNLMSLLSVHSNILQLPQGNPHE